MSTDHDLTLEQLADKISGDSTTTDYTESRIVSATAEGGRLTAGLERGEHTSNVDPSTLLREPKSDAPALMPSGKSGGSGSHAPYVMSTGLARADGLVHEGRRRPADAELAETKTAAKAWAAFIAAADEARRLTRDVPAAMGRASAARAAALQDPGESPVVLPSVADARAHAEAVAGKACRVALDLRRAYDETQVATGDERLESLIAMVPVEAAALSAAVDDLKGRVVRLRAGVDALVEQAVAGDPSVVRARMPGHAPLQHLDEVVAEVEALVAVSKSPTVPKMVPSLRDREATAAMARHMVSIPEDLVALASREAEEKAAGRPSTSFAAHVPKHLIEAWRAGAFHR